MDERGYCLVSQQIRKKIAEGLISTSKKIESLENRIQPASFEPILTDEVFILDTENKGLLRPRSHETVYRTLLQLPQRRRQRVSIEKGFELKKGFSYLFPLDERVSINANESIISSPKSSAGRAFFNNRMIADYNDSFNEFSSSYKTNTPLQLWLLSQPLAFNIVVWPETTLSQIRFFTGNNSELRPEEIKEAFDKEPLLYLREGYKEIPAKPVITNSGLQVGLDLEGKETKGIVGLRARHNPHPIDLRKISEYNAEDYFEPIENKGQEIIINAGDHCLFASKGLVNVPVHLSAELRAASNLGLTGQMHFAGFLDNGFKGSLVYEVRSDETTPMTLQDGMPLSTLEFFRTSEMPDKTYGGNIKSNYQGQIGPKVAKYFKSFDYANAAKNHKKLDRLVLVQDAKLLTAGEERKNRVELLTPVKQAHFDKIINNGFFHSRYDCETDESVLQLIPYILLFGKNEDVFSYVRADNIQDYGDERLFGKHSIGIGGHTIKEDGPNYIEGCIRREKDEEVLITGRQMKPKIVATLMAYDTPVDRVHFGLITAIHTEGEIGPKDPALHSGRMVKISDLLRDPLADKKYETWSKMLIPLLPALYSISRE